MKILLVFTLCLISDGGAFNEVTGYSGGGVLIKCKYETKYTQRPKYFCKGSRKSCSDQISAQTKNQWVNSGRFSLFDDTRSTEFWVMIRELTVQDTGMYQCGIDIDLGTDIYTMVELKVKDGPFLSREVIAYAKTKSNIKCRYEDEFTNKPKSFYKIDTVQWRFNQIRTETKRLWAHDGRFSIHDNRSAGFFNVFIRELITEDTGTYACGVVVSDEIEIYTVVKLKVTEVIQKNYADLTKQDSGEYWCGAEVNWKSYNGYKVYFTQINLTVTEFPAVIVITVSVVLLLLLIGITLLIVTSHKRRKMQGPKTTMTQACTQTNRDYENGPNVFLLQSAQQTNLPKSVDPRMDPKTNQSDSVYQSLNPNTNQSESVYQSLNPNTNQSDSVYQNLNSV